MSAQRALGLRTETLAELRPAELAAVAAADQPVTVGYHCFSVADCPLETVLNTNLC